MHIWLNKAPVQNPLLCEEDGPVYQLRRWYEQFYVDAADVTPEMTERFEFEVDTTKANEYWHAEVEENLARKAAEDATRESAEVRPDGRRRRLTPEPMASFSPTSDETLEDQRLYTQARLTEVACLDCLARVRREEEQRAPHLDPVGRRVAGRLRRVRPDGRRARRSAGLRGLPAAARLASSAPSPTARSRSGPLDGY